MGGGGAKRPCATERLLHLARNQPTKVRDKIAAQASFEFGLVNSLSRMQGQFGKLKSISVRICYPTWNTGIMYEFAPFTGRSISLKCGTIIGIGVQECKVKLDRSRCLPSDSAKMLHKGRLGQSENCREALKV